MTTTTERFHPDQRREVRDLVDAVEESDGTPPLSEYKTMRLGGGLDVREQVLLDETGRVVGYGQAAWHGSDQTVGHWALEVVVDRAYRNAAVVAPLVEGLRLDLGGGEVRLWARNDYVAVAAESKGWNRERELLEMRRSLPVEDLVVDLEGFRLSTFRIGVDEGHWLEVNNAVFAGHPENGSMTRHDLESRMAQQWFDPDGFFLAWAGDELVASCWTKLHENGVGEIYIVGVASSWEGRGLGKSLVAVGLDYLGNQRHARQGLLFVEAANQRAMALYRHLGFVEAGRISAYGYSPNV